MRFNYKKQKKFYESIGWLGAILVISAYFLVSFNVFSSGSVIFQLINLIGALCLIIISIVKKIKQTLLVNIIWASISIFAILSSIINMN